MKKIRVSLKKTMKLKPLLLILLLHQYLILAFSSSPHTNPNDATALLHFKSKADLGNKLKFSHKTAFAFCKWRGVECSHSRAIRLIVKNVKLGGVFAPNSLSQLSELRVLSLQNNALTGPIPYLSGLVNLKALYLNRNYFSGAVPPSISTLHRLKTVDLSYNMLAGSIPPSLNALDRLYYLRLDFNRFNGSVPPLNQSSLLIFNVAHNELAGAIQVTPALSRFNASSFSFNSGLCGEIVHKECRSERPFFGTPASATAAAPRSLTAALGQIARLDAAGAVGVMRQHKRAALVVAFTIGSCILVMSLICVGIVARRWRRSPEKGGVTKIGLEPSVTGNAEAVMIIEEENHELAKVKQQLVVGKSGSLMFCAGEASVYTNRGGSSTATSSHPTSSSAPTLRPA